MSIMHPNQTEKLIARNCEDDKYQVFENYAVDYYGTQRSVPLPESVSQTGVGFWLT